MTFSLAVRYLQESEEPFLVRLKDVLSQEMGNVRKCRVFTGQVGMQVFLCSLSQPAHRELPSHQQRIEDRMYLHLSSVVFAMET